MCGRYSSIFLNARQRGGSSAANVSHLQIAFIITDAIFDDESRKKVPHWIRRASEQNQLIVMIMVDKAGQQSHSGVASLKRIKYVKGKPSFVSYLDDYPFRTTLLSTTRKKSQKLYQTHLGNGSR